MENDNNIDMVGQLAFNIGLVHGLLKGTGLSVSVNEHGRIFFVDGKEVSDVKFYTEFTNRSSIVL